MEDKKKREKVSLTELKNSKAEKRIILQTGFRNIDTAIGYRVYDQDTNELIQINRGILSGSKITLIGVSHSGKSTLAVEMATNMISPWIIRKDTRAKIHVFDTEIGVNVERFKKLSKLSLENVENHVVFNKITTVEAVKKCLLNIVQEKSDKNYEMERMINHSGQEILYYSPTIIIIDSITNLITDKIADIKNDTTNAMYMQVAGEIDRFMRQNGHILHKYNITMISVAHTGKVIDPDAMPGSKPKKKWKYLPASLDIKAPQAISYGCDLGLYFDKIIAADRKAVKESAAAEWTGGKSIVSVTIFKSRQPGEGSIFYLVQVPGGFDPLASLLYECQKIGILQTKPGSRELENYGTVRSNEIISRFKTDSNFRQVLFSALDKYHEESLESNKMTKEEIQESQFIYDLLTEEF